MVSEPDPKIHKETILVRKDIPGRRIDKFLSERFPDYSRTYLQRLIADGHVRVNGAPVKRSHELSRGEVIEIELPEPEEPHIEGEDIPLDIVFEDEHILLVNKPADLIAHPARGHASGTLVNALVHHCRELSDAGGPLKPGLVHRLDRDTTGILLVAKTNKAHHDLTLQFERREVQKEYTVVVEGEVELDADVINKPVGRHPRSREKMCIRRDGREAVTAYEVAERFRGYTLLKAMPKTGRTHQIRVHFRSLNHPVVSDPLYGRRTACYLSELEDEAPKPGESPLIERQALHARSIRFRHPATGEMVRFKAPLPADLERLIAALRRYRAPG